MNPMLYLLSTTCIYACFIFFIIWINILNGYQIASLEQLGLWSTSQLSPWNGVFTRRSELSFRCLLSKVISFILNMLYIEQCLSILPLFVAICEIWLPGLTYGVYLVWFLKPGATIHKYHIFWEIWECHTMESLSFILKPILKFWILKF